MRSALVKDTFRSIVRSKGRFLAIIGIVALGCGFFAGLQMVGRDMRLAADRYYDDTALYDIRVVSSKGFDEADVRRISRIEGVEAAMGAKGADFVARLGDQQMAVRVMSLDVDAARASTTSPSGAIESGDKNYLNRPVLREGRWPRASDECVMAANASTGTDVAVGDRVKVLYGSSDVDGVLTTRSFTVVGLVSSSDFIYGGSFGVTTLGDGKVRQFLYVPGDAFSADYPLTSVYVRVAGADRYESGSPDYEAVVGAVAGRIEDEKGTLAADRLAEIRAKAQSTLDEKYADYEKGERDADEKIADAQASLDEAAKTLEDSRARLDSGWAELKRGQARLEEGVRQYEVGERELADRSEAARRELDAGQQRIDQERSAFEKAVPDPQGRLAELREQRDRLQDQVRGLEARRGDLQKQVDGLGTQLAAAQARLRQLQGSGADPALVAEAEAAVRSLESSLSQTQAGLAQVEQGVAQARSGLEQLDAAVARIEEGLRGLDEAQAKLDAERRSAEERLSSGREALEEAASTVAASRRRLADSRVRLEEGERSYADGLERYRSGLAELDARRADAEGELADARAKLERAQADVDGLEAPEIYTLDRSKNFGCEAYRSDSERMGNIADAFPAMFYLVAALVALTTMTRMVDDDRVLIGTYKALGYSTWQIASKYLVYASIASVSGALIGILALTQVLPAIVMAAYGVVYTVPLLASPLPLSVPVALFSGLVGVGVTLGSTYAAVKSSLRATPASLMLPLAPRAGRRILLERIRPVWERLSFSWKVTLRNIFRYKRRLFMTLVGISGCAALLLVGFGVRDSIWDILARQYGPITHYDVTVGLDDSATSADVEDVYRYLSAHEGVERCWRLQQENMVAGASGTKKQVNVGVVIPRDAADFPGAFSFIDRATQRELPFDSHSVIVTEKLSLLLGIRAGDRVTLFEEDGVGGAKGGGHELTVTGVCENYVGNGVYVGRDAWAAAGRPAPDFSTIYVLARLDPAQQTALSDSLHHFAGVSVVSFMSDTIAQYRVTLSVVDYVILILVVAAAALAFIVLYNLTNINVTERTREIASLKVLGFTRREIYAYIFREVLIISVMGDALGMLVGTWLEGYVITTAEVDFIMYGRAIHPVSYVYAFALTILFTLVVIVSMRPRLDRIDMVESLKSVD